MYIRREHDLLGDRDVPADAYYGVHTLRAVENFPITGTPISIYPDLIAALASIKQAAALANRELGLLDATRADAIVAACEEIRAGQLHDQFVVDVIQGGAGTSTNMNANEVIANRALELLGQPKGDYHSLHPNEHVNMSQSTNDVYPTALKLAAYFGILRLVDAMAVLRAAFEAKAEEFKDMLKMGRTQLQDAVPMTLGQEFSTYAVMLGEDEQRLREAALADPRDQHGRHRDRHRHQCASGLRRAGLRASARGHRHSRHHRAEPDRGDAGLRRLRAALGRAEAGRGQAVEDLQRPAAAVVGTARRPRRDQPAADAGGLVDHAGQGQSGDPRGGQPGRVRGDRQRHHGDLRRRGRPAAAQRLRADHRPQPVQERQAPDAGCLTLASKCVSGITANREHLRRGVEHSIGIVTALNPYIGYANATDIAQEALITGMSVYDLVLEKKLLTREQLDEILQPEVLTQPRAFRVKEPGEVHTLTKQRGQAD